MAYFMAEAGKVQVRLWNENGDLAAAPSEAQAAGYRCMRLDIKGYAPGIYYYRVVLRYDSGREERLRAGKLAILR